MGSARFLFKRDAFPTGKRKNDSMPPELTRTSDENAFTTPVSALTENVSSRTAGAFATCSRGGPPSGDEVRARASNDSTTWYVVEAAGPQRDHA
jgi:hypothetical protein